MKKRKDTEEFIKEAKRVHGGKFDYQKVIYYQYNVKINILCLTCNNYFTQTPSSHLYGHGCPHCSGNIRHTTKSFIEKAEIIHQGKYSYHKSLYVQAHKKIEIFCFICNKYFMQTPANHLFGQGCPYCKGKNKTTKSFIEEVKSIHGNNYDYSKANYLSGRVKIEIFCRTCNNYFTQTPQKHLAGQGCNICFKRNSSLLPPTYLEEAQKIKPWILYYSRIEAENTIFYKIGVSKPETLETRLKRIAYNVRGEIFLLLKKEGFRFDILLKEEQIVKDYQQLKYTGPLKFHGYTECFNQNIFSNLINDHFMELV
jgi:hypothetical protein